MTAAPSKRRAWLELLRPPNLFTVPGDPLAGFFLAAGLAATPLYRHAAVAALAALTLYMAGLIGNDAADFKEDLRDRPERPLPSGRVSLSAARAAFVGLAILALLVAATAGRPVLVTAAGVLLAVVIYNGWLKHYAVAGALAMGVCRGGSLLLGAVAAGWRPAGRGDPILIAAAGTTLYIAGVTWIADRETVVERLGARRWIPAFAILAAFAWLTVRTPGINWPFRCAAAAAVAWSAWQALRLRGLPSGRTLGSAIGGLIRGLLLIQAAFCALGGEAGLAVAAGLLPLWPFSILAGRRFYAT